MIKSFRAFFYVGSQSFLVFLQPTFATPAGQMIDYKFLKLLSSVLNNKQEVTARSLQLNHIPFDYVSVINN